jgi:hypothetical protein
MTVSRKSIVAALLAKLAASYAFGVTGQRNRSPETIAAVGAPALLLLRVAEEHEVKAVGLPPIRTIKLVAAVYIDCSDDENAIPDDIISDIHDAFDAALAADDPISGRCTLGGLCYSTKISGTSEGAPGDMTGRGLSLIPIEIVLP